MGFAVRVHKPVFPDAAAGVYVLFDGLVVLRCAGEKDFRRQVGGAINAIGFDLIRIADHHEIRDKEVFVIQMEV